MYVLVYPARYGTKLLAILDRLTIAMDTSTCIDWLATFKRKKGAAG